MDNKQKYTQRIKNESERLGFSSCGIAKATFLEEEAPRLEQWLKNDFHGDMKYMENHFDKRLDPRLLVDGAKSVISLSYNYFTESQQEKESYKISKYAYGEDYHHVVKSKLNELVADFCVDQITVQVKQHQGYIEKLTTLPTPIDRPESLNKDSYTYDISNLL